MTTSKLRVYVASNFEGFPRVREAMAALRFAGIDISHDWCELADVYPEDNAPPAERKRHAQEDLDGVRSADVVLLLCPTDRKKGLGCYFEAGAALGLGKKLVVVGEKVRPTIFYELANARFETDQEGIAYCILLAARKFAGLDSFAGAP